MRVLITLIILGLHGDLQKNFAKLFVFFEKMLYNEIAIYISASVKS